MSYSTVAEMQRSQSLLTRCTAAVAEEITAGNVDGDSRFSQQWVSERSWDLASTPGWADKWESAIASGITDPGESQSVITDADILSRVQQLLAIYPIPDTPVSP
jgi:hypothetical protein